MTANKSKLLATPSLLAAVILLTGFVNKCAEAEPGAANNTVVLDARNRLETSQGSGKFTVLYKRLEWNPAETAIIICDMWDKHWCEGATSRVAELAPAINKVVSKARDKGVLIIHSPSETMNYYKDHPARKRAQNAPKATNPPDGIGNWCKWIGKEEEETGYPIDHSDGGCDCQPKCPQGSPWRKQIDIISISDKDAISDSGVEIWNLLEHRGIKNLILMGVHTNMCVLGRPFGLRNMARFGKNVVLIRDLTDTMYNPRAKPFVSHFTGTDLVVEHVERFVCPTIPSTAFTDQPAFRFSGDKRPRVVFISAESEYKAAEALPDFAHELQMKYGLSCEILQAGTDERSKERNYICGMESLLNANLVVVFARRRAFPAKQMQYLRDYLESGKPLLALRTASHAFDTRASTPAGHVEWREFDHDVLGGNYTGHYASGPQTTVTAATAAQDHPILSGVKTPFISNGSLYKTSPLAGLAQLLLTGSIPDQKPEPVAWTNMYKQARIFYTSLGHPDDFGNPQFRRVLINAVFWAMDKPVPKEKAIR
jgi:nicotinamidase-related amidase/type 1 glutamine amidotransferase